MKEKLQKVSEFVKRRKALTGMLCALMAFVGVLTSTITANAEGAAGNIDSTMTTSLTTAFTAVKTDVVSIITTALPPALAIMGIGIAIMIGIKFFKRAAK